MKDFTNPVVTGMFILGTLMILAATTSANAATGNSGNAAAENRSAATNQQQGHIRELLRHEAALQLEIQRATSLHLQAKQRADNLGRKAGPGCVICKID